MRRPWEWESPEPVTRRDQVLAALVNDPPSSGPARPADQQAETEHKAEAER